MTDDDKALVERLLERNGYNDSLMEEAADRIEALSAENERLREALREIILDFESASILCREGDYTARAALGEAK